MLYPSAMNLSERSLTRSQRAFRAEIPHGVLSRRGQVSDGLNETKPCLGDSVPVNFPTCTYSG